MSNRCPRCLEPGKYLNSKWRGACGSEWGGSSDFEQSRLCKTLYTLIKAQDVLKRVESEKALETRRADSAERRLAYALNDLADCRKKAAELNRLLKGQAERAEVAESALDDIIDRAKLHRVEVITSNRRHLYWKIQQKYSIDFDERTCPALAAHMQARDTT